MRYYTVHTPSGGADEPEDFVFVKDGFSWPALFFPLLWILWQRLWLTLVYYIVFLLVVAWAGRLLGDDPAIQIATLGSLLFAFEANGLRRAALTARGFEEIGMSFGRNFGEAEARFFSDHAASRPSLDRRAAMVRASYPSRHRPEHGATASDDPILGLFPEPER